MKGRGEEDVGIEEEIRGKGREKSEGRTKRGTQAKRNRQMDCEKKALVVAGFCGR